MGTERLRFRTIYFSVSYSTIGSWDLDRRCSHRARCYTSATSPSGEGRLRDIEGTSRVNCDDVNGACSAIGGDIFQLPASAAQGGVPGEQRDAPYVGEFGDHS